MRPGTLYVVATPVGHLGDLSDRARHVLATVSLVAAEDTRRTAVLLQHAGAHPRVLSYHAHSSSSRLDRLLAELRAGRDVALVTDAGTPAISDPGGILVRAARNGGFPVVAVPGPSAVTAALSICGLPADRYLFLGFLPRRGADRRHLLAAAADSPWTVVLFEAPTRLVRLLRDLQAAGGHDREAAVARELTKRHEECKLGTLSDLAGYYELHPPRGEVTVVLSGAVREEPPPTPGALERRARELLEEGFSRRDAADQLATEFACPRRDAYRTVTEL